MLSRNYAMILSISFTFLKKSVIVRTKYVKENKCSVESDLPKVENILILMDLKINLQIKRFKYFENEPQIQNFRLKPKL